MTARAASSTRAEPPNSPPPLPTAKARPAATPDASPKPQVDETPQLLAPAPIPPGERLQPCRVELEHRYVDYHRGDDAWETVTLPVPRLVRDWRRWRSEIDWLRAPSAPIPLTRDQLRAHPSAAEHDDWHFTLYFNDSSFSYRLDARGRTLFVHFDPHADRFVYFFRYSYDCDPGRAAPPIWRG